MVLKSIIGATCTCLAVVSFSADAALVGRDLDGNLSTAEAYYDDVAGLTWLGDANYSMTSGYHPNGKMDWFGAQAWAAGLNYFGTTEWRLPETTINCGSSYCTDTLSELGNLYHNTLNGTFVGNNDFSNIKIYDWYWSSEYRPGNGTGYAYVVNSGLQAIIGQSSNNYAYAWAVHTGDVGAAVVPIPSAVWLFGSGLIGLVGVARRKKA